MAKFKTAYIIFKDSEYNYSTSVNSNLTDAQIKNHFINSSINMGGISYDFKNNCEVEVSDLQTCIDCIIEPLKEI